MKRTSAILILLIVSILPLFAEGTGYVTLGDKDFYDVTGDDIYIVDFYADWCGPCRAFAPTFEQVSKEMDMYNFAKVDVDYSPNLSKDFEIRYIPFVVAVQNGKVIEQYAGTRTAKDFTKWVESIYRKNQS